VAHVAGSTIETVDDADAELVVPALHLDDVEQRLRERHRLYLARRDGLELGHGWCATETASISELGIDLVLPPSNRYLWGFFTVPEWRGRGIYPALLQAMLSEEHANRFWIGHDMGNEASRRGILNAGFRPVGPVIERLDGRLVFAPPRLTERASACEALFGIPVSSS
jgi:GNAT superfamily N-acetyltransferase